MAPRLPHIILLASLPVVASAQDDDQGLITSFIEENLSSTSATVDITGFQGALSSRATIEKLTVSDQQGEWLVLEGVVLDWTRAKLFVGEVDIKDLTADRIAVLRAPVPEASSPSAEATPFSLPNLPVSVDIETIRADRIELDDSFVGEDLVATLDGKVSLVSGALDTTVDLFRTDGKLGRFEIDLTYANSDRILDLALVAEEGPGGLAVDKLGVQGRPAAKLSISGNAPIDDFIADVALATDGVDRIDGQVRYAAAPENPELTAEFDLDLGGDISTLIAPDYQSFFGSNVLLRAEGFRQTDGTVELKDFALSAADAFMTGSLRVDRNGWPERFAVTGDLGSPYGPLIRLPVAGGDTYARSGILNAAYDRAGGEQWIARFTLDTLERPDLTLGTLEMRGGGIIKPPTEDTPGRWIAIGTHTATDLQLADAGLASAVGDNVTGRFQAYGGSSGPIRFPAFTLKGAGLDVKAQATVARFDARFRTEASLTLKSDDMARLAPLTGMNLGGAGDLALSMVAAPLDADLDLAVTGHTQDLSIGMAQIDAILAGAGEIDIAIERDQQGTRVPALTIATDHGQITGRADVTSGVSDVNLTAVLPETNILSPELSGPGEIALVAKRGEEGVAQANLTLDIPEVAGNITADIQPKAQQFMTNAVGRLTLGDLSPYSDLIGRELGGSGTAIFSASGLPEKQTGRVAIDAATLDLALGIPILDALLAGAGKLTGTVERRPDEALVVDNLKLRTPELTADIDGMFAKQGGDAKLFLQIPDASVLSPDLSGVMEMNGTAQLGADERTRFQLNATIPDIQAVMSGEIAPPTDDSRTTFNARVQADKLSGYRDLLKRPVSGSARATARGSFMPFSQAFDITAEGLTQSLRLGIDPVDRLLRGRSDFSFAASRADNGDMELNDLSFQNPQSEATGSGSLKDGHIVGALDARVYEAGKVIPGVSGPVTVTGRAEGQDDRTTVVTLQGGSPNSSLNLNATLDTPDNDYSAKFSGDVRFDRLASYRAFVGMPLSGALSANLSGTAEPLSGALTASVNTRLGNVAIGNPSVDPIIAGQGKLTTNVSRTASGDLSFQNARLDLPNITASGDVSRSAAGALSALFDARLADLAAVTDQVSGALTASGSVQQRGNTTTVDVTAGGPGGTSARIAGQLNGANAQLGITGSLPLALANKALAPRSVTGTADVDLALNGPLALSSLTGRVSTQNSRLSLPQLGESVDNITGSFIFGGARVTADLSAALSRGGQVQVTGPLDLTASRQAAFVITASDLVIKDPALFETRADGRITVTGPLSGGAVIAGDINLGETEVRVPSNTIGTIGSLPEVQHVGAPQAVVTTLKRAGLSIAGINLRRGGDASGAGATPAAVFPMDININAPSRIFIRGRGLDAELGGSVRIGGTTKRMIPAGRFELVRGRINILQQRFDLTEGFATLEGDFTPYIRLVATTETEYITVNIIAEGDATEPEISFISVPELPPDEVLSRLIFGRDLSSISPLQAVQLAAAANTLAGRGNGGLVGRLRDNVGLDDLDITTSEEGTTAVRAGKYITENIYTDVTVDSEGKTEVDINLDLTDSLTVRGASDTEGKSSIGIFFEKDY